MADRSRDRARDLVAKLAARATALREREIIAPVLPGAKVRTRLDGLVYEFSATRPYSGWGVFRPVSELAVEPVGEALPWQRGAYLELFPKLRVLLLWPEPERQGTWWALPYNESDARQRFGLPGEPVPVLLCDENGVERFERVITRVDGETLWFDGPDSTADPARGEVLREIASAQDPPERLPPGLAASERASLLYFRIHQLEEAGRGKDLRERIGAMDKREQEELLRRDAGRFLLDERLRHALEKAGAELLGYTEILGRDGQVTGITVEWRERGEVRRYRTQLDADFTVVSSGICLSGRDRDFDLTSLVSVMNRAPGWAADDDDEY